MFIVYLIENKITNKCYVGYTKHSLKKRWSQHCKKSTKQLNTPFYNAIKKYGIECWDKKVLLECNTVEEAKTKEIELIQKFDSYKNGYNATLGGDGNNGIIMTDESNIKRSLALKGKPKNYLRMHGKKHSEETLKKMRKPKDNKKSYQTEHFKQKMREAQAIYAKQRRVLSEEQYNKIQEMVKLGISKKQISVALSINYDIVKKWSCRKW